MGKSGPCAATSLIEKKQREKSARPVDITIVVPTSRKQGTLDFLAAWAKEFAKHRLLIIEDNPEKTFDCPATNAAHFCWSDIENEFGRNSWIIPKRTDCIRSFGYYKAFQSGADVIVSLDDDCYPSRGEYLLRHVRNLNTPTSSHAWVSTGTGAQPRGMPYRNFERTSECVVSHGLWQTNPDFDAVTELNMSRSLGASFEPVNQVIPRGVYFPMCGMNLAFKRKMLPAMYFLLMGKDCPFDRFGDIWCGILVKKICDHLGLAVRSGEPSVVHHRASNVWANLRKELPGYELNEEFWEQVDSIVLTKTTVSDCYREIANKLQIRGDYWQRCRRAMKFWADLFGSRTDKTVDIQTLDGLDPVRHIPVTALSKSVQISSWSTLSQSPSDAKSSSDVRLPSKTGHLTYNRRTRRGVISRTQSADVSRHGRHMASK